MKRFVKLSSCPIREFVILASQEVCFFLPVHQGLAKRETARALAQALFGSDWALIRFDMSEYSDRLNLSRLIGSAPGYIGYEELGKLTQALRDHPHSVVLLDEIEKACSEIFDLFLQLFDEVVLRQLAWPLGRWKKCDLHNDKQPRCK